MQGNLQSLLHCLFGHCIQIKYQLASALDVCCCCCCYCLADFFGNFQSAHRNAKCQIGGQRQQAANKSIDKQPHCELCPGAEPKQTSPPHKLFNQRKRIAYNFTLQEIGFKNVLLTKKYVTQLCQLHKNLIICIKLNFLHFLTFFQRSSLTFQLRFSHCWFTLNK